MTLRIPSVGVALALLLAAAAWAESGEVGALYRCPGNDYSNTISAAEAEKLRCRKVENASVTVIRSAIPAEASGSSAAASAPVPAAAPVRAGPMDADSAALRARASNSRRTLEGRLQTEQRQLSALEKEFNGGEPERRVEEIDLQKYLDRVAQMRSSIALKQIEIAELRREIGKLPTR